MVFLYILQMFTGWLMPHHGVAGGGKKPHVA